MGKIVHLNRIDNDLTFESYIQTTLDQIYNKMSEKKEPETLERIKFIIPLSDGFEVLNMKDIIHCEAHGNYTKIYLEDQTSRLLCKTLKWMMNKLPCDLFLRTHHSHIVNVDCITRFFKGESALQLNKKALVPISRRKKEYVEQLLLQKYNLDN